MDSLTSFVKKLVDAIEKERLEYAFTGALAASFYGVPRTTADIDVLVTVTGKAAKTKLSTALRQAGLEVDEKTIDDALASSYRIATFHCKTSAYRVDVILSDQIRKRSGNIAGVDTFLQVPEDLVNAKLRMIKATTDEERTQKDEDDVRAILRFTEVDKKTIHDQAKKDGTVSFWERFVNE